MQNRYEVKQQMFAHIEQWTASNLSQKAYCQQHQLTYHSFHYWYKRYKNDRQLEPASSFIPLQIQPPPAQEHVEMILTDGRRIVFHQPVSSAFLKELTS